MNHELSPQTEQFLASMVAQGQFPSKEAAIEAAVAALREKAASIQYVPDEHMASVEEAIEESRAGKARPMTNADWAELRQVARDSAARNASRND